MLESHGTAENTDKELWREVAGEFYAPSIHVTAHGGIGINVGGFVYVLPVRTWHRLAADAFPPLRTILSQPNEEGEGK